VPQLDLAEKDIRDLHEAAMSHKSLSVSTKAATDSTTIIPAALPDFRLPPVTALREPTRVLSLLPTFATNNSSVEWFSTTGTTAAAAVAEGAAKPTSTIAYPAQTTSATKLAHVAEVTDETLRDFPAFMGVLETDMTAGLIKAENDELLNAAVAGAHKWPGLLAASGILTQAKGAESDLDTISMAFDALRVGASFVEPDGLAIHPTTWGIIRRLKDSQGRYYLTPDPTVDTNLTLWNVPVVLSTQIAVGTALLGAFAQSVAVYVREGIRVEVSNLGSTQFTNNTCLIRCEERLISTVVRPSGLCKITGLI
jgi:HK97 family phage major capsid protein